MLSQGTVLDLLLPFLKYLVWLEVALSNHKSATLPLHHLFQVAVAERVAQVPPDAQQDDIGLKMTPFEWLLRVHGLGVGG